MEGVSVTSCDANIQPGSLWLLCLKQAGSDCKTGDASKTSNITRGKRPRAAADLAENC